MYTVLYTNIWILKSGSFFSDGMGGFNNTIKVDLSDMEVFEALDTDTLQQKPIPVECLADDSYGRRIPDPDLSRCVHRNHYKIGFKTPYFDVIKFLRRYATLHKTSKWMRNFSRRNTQDTSAKARKCKMLYEHFAKDQVIWIILLLGDSWFNLVMTYFLDELSLAAAAAA